MGVGKLGLELGRPPYSALLDEHDDKWLVAYFFVVGVLDIVWGDLGVRTFRAGLALGVRRRAPLPPKELLKRASAATEQRPRSLHQKKYDDDIKKKAKQYIDLDET